MSCNIARFVHFSLEIEFNALRFINYTIPRLCSTYAVAILGEIKNVSKLATTIILFENKYREVMVKSTEIGQNSTLMVMTFDSVTHLKKLYSREPLIVTFQMMYHLPGFAEVQLFPLFSVMMLL